MFFVQNTSAQFKIIDSLMKSSNQSSNISFVQIQPIQRPHITKSPEARRFDVNENMGYIKIITEPTESIQRMIPEVPTIEEPKIIHIKTLNTRGHGTYKFMRAKPKRKFTKLIAKKVKSAVDKKRRYRSRCRCEKISNCPRIQISVARCPSEYFLCCF